MRWNSEERAFAVEAYFSSGCSVIATQRAFRNRFNLAPLAPVPDRKSIVTWVTTFRQTASATRRKTGVPRPIRSPENIEAVRASILQSPRRSARKHASALELSDRSVRRILHDDLHYHPYKMARRCNGSTSRAAMGVLREHFPERLISIRGDLEWPAHSPNLAPCDFFLWGFLKSCVYVNHPRTLQALKTNIQEEIANITPAMLARVMTNARNRFTQCMENGGRHLPDLIFKTV